MNKEALEKRIGELTSVEQQLHKQMAEVQANLNATLGAKQDCQFWLNAIGSPTELPDETKIIEASGSSEGAAS